MNIKSGGNAVRKFFFSIFTCWRLGVDVLIFSDVYLIVMMMIKIWMGESCFSFRLLWIKGRLRILVFLFLKFSNLKYLWILLGAECAIKTLFYKFQQIYVGNKVLCKLHAIKFKWNFGGFRFWRFFSFAERKLYHFCGFYCCPLFFFCRFSYELCCLFLGHNLIIC